MTLKLGEVLIGNAQALMMAPADDSAGEYSSGMAGVVAMLCMLAAQDAESAAARMHAENRDTRALFAAAVAEGNAGPLSATLAELAGEHDDDLRLSALEQSGDRLRDALIALHVHSEDTGARGLEFRILELLQRAAQARRLLIPH